MNIRHLEVFRAVARAGSVTGAARLLGVSQPAVSKMLREAEAQLGGKLFERRGGRLRERPETALLAEAVEDVFFHIERVRVTAERLRHPESVPLRIGAFPAATFTVLPAAISSFRAQWPTKHIETRALLAREIVERIAIGSLDLGIIYKSAEPGGADALELPPAQIVCGMPPHHPLAGQKVVTPFDLQTHPFVSFHLAGDEAISLTIREGFRQLGVPFNPAVLVDHSIAACALAEQGVGVALVTPFLFTSGLFRNLVFVPLTPPFFVWPQILCRDENPLPAETSAMIRCLKQAWVGSRGRA